MDEIFKSEVIVVVMEKEEGVSFQDFSGLFHQVHGYQLKLINYGYKSLKDLLNDMKNEVEILNVNGQQLIKCRPPRPLNVIAPSTDISSQKNEPFMTEPCSASSNKCWPQSGDNLLDEFPKAQPSCKPKEPRIRCHKLLPPAKQSTLQSQDYSTSEVSCTEHTCHTRKQMPSNEIVEIISQKMRSHHTGLRAEKLRQYILGQHKIDLELHSQELGYTDMLSMLIEIPVIKFRNTSGKDIIIESNLFEDQDLPSAKVELCNAGPSSTSRLSPSAKDSAQPDVSSNKKNANQEHLGSIASPSQKNNPIISEICTAYLHDPGSKTGDNLLDEFPKAQPSCKPKEPRIRCHKLLPPAKQSTLQSQDYSTSEVSCTEHTCHTRKQMPSNEIVEIISQKMRSHHTGLRAEQLRQYILGQHKIDLELHSQELGYTDMLSMLIEIPVIKFRNTSGKDIIIESNLFEDQDLPSAKVELCNAGPSSTSRLSPSAKDSAQPDVSSNKKNANQEHLGSIASPSQKNNPIISEICTAYLHDPGSKTEFTRKVNHTQTISSHEDPTPILTVDGNAEKKNNPNTTQKYNNSQPKPPNKHQLFLNKVADVLRVFPSGLRIEKLKQHVLNTHHIDLEALSKELGYNDMPSMLKQVPGIASLNGDVFFASVIPKSKEKLKQVKKVKFSEKLLVDFLKKFPFGLKVDNLRRHITNQYKIDLMKYSQEKGSTGMVDMLQKVPGITVLNKDLIIASDFYKMSNSKSNATIKTTPVKCPISATPGVKKSLKVKIKTPKVSQVVTKPSATRPTGTSQQISLPTHHNPFTNAMINSPQNVRQQIFLPACQIPITNATINSPQNVHQGLRPNISYASACASNLRTDQVNVQSLQCPPTFNGQKAHTVKIAHPNLKEAPKDVIQSSNIKDKLKLLLKSHSNGLSIFQLKKLFLLKFQQPLACRGASVRKILKNVEDVANIKGVGVQMKVFPVVSEDNPSANICSDSTPQGAAVSSPLSIKNNTEHIKHSVPVLLSRQQPSSSGYSHTELTGGHIPMSSSGDFSHKQTICHTTDYLHPAGDAENTRDAQWPLLPQKFNILKEIKQRAKVSDQLPENIPNNDLCLKPNPTATSQPQGKDNSAQSLLEAHQVPSKTPCKIDDRQEPQTSDLVLPIQQPGFSFVLEETGFSFLMGETNVDKDKKSMEMALVGPPPNTFKDSTQVVSELSGIEAKRNTHATQNQSAHCNMAAPEARKHSVNVLPQQLMADFSSKKVPQQTDTHLVTSGFSTPNQKSNDSQSQQGPTHNILEPKRQPVTPAQTCFTSLQAQGIPPSSTTVQMVSMPPKEQETSSSKSVCEFEQRWSTPLPSKQEAAKSNPNNKSGLTGSPNSQSPEKAPISKTKMNTGNQHVPTEKNLTGVQTATNGRQASPPESQIQQEPMNPSVDTIGDPISDTLHKDVELNAVNGHILKTQKKEHLQTTPAQTCFRSLQAQGIPPSSTTVQMVSMPPKEQETPSSKSVCEFEQRRSTPLPSKQEAAKSNPNNNSGLTGSPLPSKQEAAKSNPNNNSGLTGSPLPSKQEAAKSNPNNNSGLTGSPLPSKQEAAKSNPNNNSGLTGSPLPSKQEAAKSNPNNNSGLTGSPLSSKQEAAKSNPNNNSGLTGSPLSSKQEAAKSNPNNNSGLTGSPLPSKQEAAKSNPNNNSGLTGSPLPSKQEAAKSNPNNNSGLTGSPLPSKQEAAKSNPNNNSGLTGSPLPSKQEAAKSNPNNNSGLTGSPLPSKQEAAKSNPNNNSGLTGSPLSSKQEAAKSNPNNNSGLIGSPKSQSPDKAPISKTQMNAGNQHVPTEKNLTGEQTASNGRQTSPPESQIQQEPMNPSVDTNGDPISDTLHKDVEFNSVNEQSLKTQKKEHLQTRDGVFGAKTPPSSSQQNANTSHVYTHEPTVTFQVQPKVPDPHTSSSMEQIRSSPREHHYYNGAAGTAPEQQVSHWDHSAPPVLSGQPITPNNQQDSSDNSSEESTKTWQTESNTNCCIL
ncbi:uncharacterized protein LOC120915280 isoform X2 [Rana temporaria]|uniref:uncharacterized protein LOC120915280 isoform X2 n=1 Tax=Rana temporaria TaxID=8407 RepID=UPI001AAD7BD9|nr:uncharacterized protein LOC120915280 isoform X2 [Rana temporaria]